MTDRCSAGTHNTCAVADDGSIFQACYDYSTGHPPEKDGQASTTRCPASTEATQPRSTTSGRSQSTFTPWISITKMVLRQNRGSHKFKKAIKTAYRIFGPERAAQTQGGSKKGAGVDKDTVTSVDQPEQYQSRQANQEKFQLPRNVRTYPVRSAVRGSRPRRATDSARHVHFAAEVEQSIDQKHEIPRRPRNYPLRSAMRGSRPKQAKDSSRHVHFACGARRLPGDTDPEMVP